MLITITNKCLMECPHCMVNATKDNKEFMSFQTLKNCEPLLDNSFAILISGGEPTEHPQFFEFCMWLINRYPRKAIALLSNGMFITDAYKTHRIEQLLEEPNFSIQITKDKRFYPIDVDLSHKIFSNNKVSIEENLRHLVPIGRAKNIIDNYPELKEAGRKKVRPCFNFKANLKGFHYDILNYIKFREFTSFKFCSFHIGPDGGWYFGECFHSPFINVNDDNWIEKANKKARNMDINEICPGCPEIIG